MRKFLKIAESPKEILTPKGFALRAVIISLVFLVCHIAGFRSLTSVLCGMKPVTGALGYFAALLGFVYVLMYLAFTVVAPVLLIAAGLLFLTERFHARHKE
jgi:hypothetical protein